MVDEKPRVCEICGVEVHRQPGDSWAGKEMMRHLEVVHPRELPKSHLARVVDELSRNPATHIALPGDDNLIARITTVDTNPFTTVFALVISDTATHEQLYHATGRFKLGEYAPVIQWAYGMLTEQAAKVS